MNWENIEADWTDENAISDWFMSTWYTYIINYIRSGIIKKQSQTAEEKDYSVDIDDFYYNYMIERLISNFQDRDPLITNRRIVAYSNLIDDIRSSKIGSIIEKMITSAARRSIMMKGSVEKITLFQHTPNEQIEQAHPIIINNITKHRLKEGNNDD